MPANVSLLSYNLKFHAAYREVAALAAEYNPDLVCLQECFADQLHGQLGHLTLAAKTTTGQLGLALYCRSSRFSVISATSHPLPLSLSERIRPEARERLLVIELQDSETNSRLLIGVLHATHLVASNRLRRRQIDAAFSALNKMSQRLPIILIGDYNYPFFHRGLSRFVRRRGYQLVKSTLHTFSNFFFAGSFDFATVANITDKLVETLPYGESDHAPILLRATLG